MSIQTPEIPSAFGALDSTVFADGGAADASVLRELARSSNRLACTGEPLLRLIYDASTDSLGDTSAGRLLAYGEPFWFALTPPLTRPKHPGLTRAKLWVYFQARSGEKLHMQVSTSALPFSATAPDDAANVVTLAGTGADAWASLDNIPIAPGNVDYLQLWLRGSPTSTAGSTGTYGSPNTGTITGLPAANIVEDTTATWTNGATNWATGGHVITFEDGSGNQIGQPRAITNVLGDDWLQIYPPIDPGWSQQVIVGATYHIYEASQIRLYSAMLYAKDRVG